MRGFSARGLENTVKDLLGSPSGLSAPLQDVLQGVEDYLDNLAIGDDDNDLRPPQTDRHLLQIIGNTTVAGDEFTLPPATVVRGDMDAVDRLIRDEKVGYLAGLGELEGRAGFPADFIDIFQEPDTFAESFLEGEIQSCKVDSRKRRQLDGHLSGKPTPPPDEEAIANDHRDPATAGAARHGGCCRCCVMACPG